MSETICFREAPGVAEIEAQLEKIDRLMLDERVELFERIDATSRSLFGITERDTWYVNVPLEARPADQKEWEAHFEFLEFEYDEEDQFWSAFGIDVSDGDGEELACLQVFGRQLVCALKRIHPLAALQFEPGQATKERLDQIAEEWGQRVFGRKPSRT